jgi:hypothetical protein
VHDVEALILKREILVQICKGNFYSSALGSQTSLLQKLCTIDLFFSGLLCYFQGKLAIYAA